MYNQPVVIYRTPEADRKNSILRYIGSRVLKSNKNFLCAVTGQTGAGKSWAVGSMSEIYSKMFDIPYDPNKQVMFSLKEFLQIIAKGEEDNLIQFGSVLSFDEMQIDANARNWQSQANKIMASLVSTFRNKRLVVFFPTPRLDALDRQTRLLFHAEFQVMGYDRNTRITKIKPRFLTDFNKLKDDFYRKRLIVRYKVPDKQRMCSYKVQDWEIPSPSNEWIKIYEGKKKQFTDELNNKLYRQTVKEEKDNSEYDFLKIAKAYDDYGEDYLMFAKEFPHIPIRTIERLVYLVKKSKKATITDTAEGLLA